MLGRVKAKDVLPLSRSRINGSHVLTALHFPNRRDHSVLFYCVIRDVLGRRLCGWVFTWVSRAFGLRAFILRHFYFNTPLETS